MSSHSGGTGKRIDVLVNMEVEAGGPPPESVGWGGFEEVQVGVAIPATGEKISFALGRTAGKPRVQQRRREAVSDGTLPQLP